MKPALVLSCTCIYSENTYARSVICDETRPDDVMSTDNELILETSASLAEMHGSERK
jgi:hypothetical protein